MTKYVVSGYIGFDNFGDELIAKILVQKLKSLKAEKITLISSKPEVTKKLYDVESCSMFGFLKSLAETDILISGGGSLLQDATSLKSLIYYLGVIFCALIFRKKVIIFAQGIGPINSKIGRFLTKIILKKANEITVRDVKSKELLESWKIESKVVKDPVFELELKPKNVKNIVGIQLRDCKQIQENPIFLKNLAQQIAEKFKTQEIHIISLHDSYDKDICHQFALYLKESGIQKVKIFENLSLDSAISCLSELEYLVAMRFHANVIGIKSKVKVAAINYDPKVEKLSKEYGIPLIEIENDNLGEMFEKLLNS